MIHETFSDAIRANLALVPWPAICAIAAFTFVAAIVGGAWGAR